MITFIRYIRARLKPSVCVLYIGDFVIPGFVLSAVCSLHFTSTLAGLKNIVHYTGMGRLYNEFRYIRFPL